MDHSDVEFRVVIQRQCGHIEVFFEEALHWTGIQAHSWILHWWWSVSCLTQDWRVTEKFKSSKVKDQTLEQKNSSTYHLGIYKGFRSSVPGMGVGGEWGKDQCIFFLWYHKVRNGHIFFGAGNRWEKKNQIINFQILTLRLDEFNKLLQNNN